jgi:phospholipase C
VSWKWYSGGLGRWLASTASNPTNNGVVPPNPPVDPLFQWHHQPFAYCDNYAPWINGARNPVSAAHLQDENMFFADLTNESLLSVVFIKPLGPNNEHPGYASLLQGQQHVADIVNTVENGNYWENSLIIVTYHEHGGGGITFLGRWFPGSGNRDGSLRQERLCRSCAARHAVDFKDD